jgi:hypothetical protein
MCGSCCCLWWLHRSRLKISASSRNVDFGGRLTPSPPLSLHLRGICGQTKQTWMCVVVSLVAADAGMYVAKKSKFEWVWSSGQTTQISCALYHYYMYTVCMCTCGVYAVYLLWCIYHTVLVSPYIITPAQTIQHSAPESPFQLVRALSALSARLSFAKTTAICCLPPTG